MVEQELSITRVISYPIEIVFNAWTNADQLVNWFAPRGCKLLVSKLEIREGGQFHWCIKNPKYPDCWCIGQFIQIKYPSILQYKIRLADQEGNPVSAKEALKETNWPEETIVTVKFNKSGDYTKVTISQTVVEALAKNTGAYQGWIDMIDILEIYLSTIILQLPKQQ